MAKRLISLAALMLCLAALCGCGASAFSTERWLNDPDNRTAIVDDLLENYPLVGMTEQEILDLLGDHDNSAGYFVEEDRYVYCLGIERGLIAIDCEWLLIDFENGVVADYSVTAD